MAPTLLKEPLSATIKERLGRAQRVALATRLSAHRVAPPTALRIASVHQLPAPTREPAEPMAKRQKHTRYDAEYKAKLVARALKAKDTQEESIEEIARAEGIHGSNIHNWIKAAQKANGASNGASTGDTGSAKGKSGGKSSGDLKSLSRELADLMDRVSAVKKRMRKLLVD